MLRQFAPTRCDQVLEHQGLVRTPRDCLQWPCARPAGVGNDRAGRARSRTSTPHARTLFATASLPRVVSR
jgi:hypothetical protein